MYLTIPKWSRPWSGHQIINSYHHCHICLHHLHVCFPLEQPLNSLSFVLGAFSMQNCSKCGLLGMVFGYIKKTMAWQQKMHKIFLWSNFIKMAQHNLIVPLQQIMQPQAIDTENWLLLQLLPVVQDDLSVIEFPARHAMLAYAKRCSHCPIQHMSFQANGHKSRWICMLLP